MWPGGYGQASYILQSSSETPQHDRIVDFACGCGVGAVAALRTKIPRVLAIDICPYATMSTLMNVHGCLFDNGYLNVLYGMRCFVGWKSLMILVVSAVVIPV